jgi:Raf kinase inhibitor-like YbhB/YbcL family protein
MRAEMGKRAGIALMIFAATSCGGAGKDERMNDNATMTELSLSSGDLADGQPIPVAHTCDGTDRSPAFNWDEPPEGTRSFAIVADDPDAPNGLFRHWGMYDIPPQTRSLSSGQTLGKVAVNDFGKPGYGGPCPPKGHGPHHYHFKLFALDTDQLDLPDGAKVAEVEKVAKQHAIGEGELVATYERR